MSSLHVIFAYNFLDNLIFDRYFLFWSTQQPFVRSFLIMLKDIADNISIILSDKLVDDVNSLIINIAGHDAISQELKSVIFMYFIFYSFIF